MKKESKCRNNEAMKLEAVLKQAKKKLTDFGIENAVLDARALMEYVTGLSSTEIHLSGDLNLDPLTQERFNQMLQERLEHKPLAYIVGEKEFYGHRFYLNEACLIPRPDTETVVEECLKILKRHSFKRVFDLCTGSGAIGLSLLKENNNVHVTASDISASALKAAKKNAEALGVAERFEARLGDLFAPFSSLDQKADLIVANPPYVSKTAYQNLERTVLDFEPKLALLAPDERGVSFYERIIKEAPNYLKGGGFLVLEIGFDQAQWVHEFVSELWREFLVVKDLANNDRVVIMSLVN